MVRRATAVLAIALAAWGLSGPALAFRVENGGSAGVDGRIAVSPSAARVTTVREDGTGAPIGPGTVAKRTVIVQNRSENTVAFDLDVAEVVGSTGEQVVEVRSGSRGGAAAWATLERSTITLKSGQTGFVDLRIAIPKAIKPGSKPFAVTVTQRPASTQQSSGAGVQPIFRQVSIFIVDLPGDAPVKGRISHAELAAASDRNRPDGRAIPIYPGSQHMRAFVEYRNDGERLLNPTGSIEVRNIWGHLAHRYKLSGLTTYPGGSHSIDVDLDKLPSFGYFTARVVLDSDVGKQTKDLGTFVLVPWWMLIVLGLLLAFAVYQFVRWGLDRRLLRRLEAEDDGYDDPEFGDDDESDDLDDDGV